MEAKTLKGREKGQKIMNKIAVIFGTRPEIIKLYPVIKELKKHNIKLCVIFTGQHMQLGEQMLSALHVQADYRLQVMTKNQTLSKITSRLYDSLEKILLKEKPELIIIQGDTATALVGATIAYYHKIPTAHVEAGLRTGNLYQPFPEEGNRRMIDQISKYNFTPTQIAADNLKKENVLGEILVTGNTGIDTLLEVAAKMEVKQKKQILITLHRRENLGAPLRNILKGIDLFTQECPDWEILFSVHPSPNVHNVIFNKLRRNKSVRLVGPFDYIKMVQTMKESAFILTDSGGIQEEASSLNKPVLVARETTERPEGINMGVALLVGTNAQVISKAMIKITKNQEVYRSMIGKKNPYGDGKAAKRIVSHLLLKMLRGEEGRSK